MTDIQSDVLLIAGLVGGMLPLTITNFVLVLMLKHKVEKLEKK